MVYTTLAPGARTLFHLKAFVRLFLFWTPFVLALSLVLVVVASPVIGLVTGVVLWLVIAVTSIWYPSFAYERWGYLLHEDVLLITWGVLFRHVVAIPLHRVQHVDTHQGPLDQLFGLARIQIYTASGMGADGMIPGLEREEAQRIREILIEFGGDDGV